jgi:hypothetical protein
VQQILILIEALIQTGPSSYWCSEGLQKRSEERRKGCAADPHFNRGPKSDGPILFLMLTSFLTCCAADAFVTKAMTQAHPPILSMRIRPARAGERNRACGWIPILSMHIRPERAGERNRACGWMKERGIQSGPTVELLRCTQRKCKSKCPHTHNLYWTKMEVNAHTIHSLHNTKMEVNAHKTHNMH